MAKRKHTTKIRIDGEDFAKEGQIGHFAGNLIRDQGWTVGRFAATRYGNKASPLSADAWIYSLEGSLMAATYKMKAPVSLYKEAIRPALTEWMAGKGLISPVGRPQEWNDIDCEDAKDCEALLRAFARSRSRLHAEKHGYRLAPRFS